MRNKLEVDLGQETMTEATDTFIEGADWLTEHDQAAVTALRLVARELDKVATASMVAQWNKLYSDLRNRRQEEPAEAIDGDEQALRDLGL